MAATLRGAQTLQIGRDPWLVVLAGLAALYVPVYWWAASTIWQEDDHAHGALILAVVLWLFWDRRHAVLETPTKPAPIAGSIAIAVGLTAYTLGRILSFSILEFASQIPMVLGTLLILKGWSAVRVAWFPVLYLVFMIPLPGFLVESITGVLKQWVSEIAENVLYAAGYPVGRSGVMLSVGQYQLLVADACSGLHSMFSLAALGLLMMYISARKSLLHNAVMLASIVPIALCANIVRVMILVLVTYYFGDEAGQGFLHGAAGLVLMLAALGVFFAVDLLLRRASLWLHRVQ